ncbi:MAG: hypothetical protein GY953_33130, partial [bacterium]|nr:hypothetical protein [bacterium]
MPQRKYSKERSRFRSLLLANPNYFGNLKDSKLKPICPLKRNTYYERIASVGYQPQFERLEAVVYVKQPSGYGGNVCSPGSREYVRFYLSFDGGTTWVDQGVSSFRTYDMPECTEGRKRLEYALTCRVNPPKKFCIFHNLILARAILSWNVPPPPNDPGYDPVWGNVHDTHIQAEHFRLIILHDFYKAVDLEVPPALKEVVDLKQAVPAAKKKLSVAELAKLYAGKKVEPHRFAFQAIQQLVSAVPDEPQAA